MLKYYIETKKKGLDPVKKIWSVIMVIAVFFSLMIVSKAQVVKANSENEYWFLMIQNAYDTQMGIGGKSGTKEEIFEFLGPYFTDEFKEKFFQEHVYFIQDKYFVLGTDNPVYYIPLFSYSEKTKTLKVNNNEVIVYEYFPPKTLGPVKHNGLYEGVKLVKKDEGWKIHSIIKHKEIIDFIHKLEPENNLYSQNESKMRIAKKLYEKPILFVSLFFKLIR